MKIYIPGKTEWTTAQEFLKDAFELVYDNNDPIDSITVLKDVGSQGHRLELQIDGDLFCTIYLYAQDDRQVDSFRWQGSWAFHNCPMSDFTRYLQNVLKSFETEQKGDRWEELRTVIKSNIKFF